MNNPFQFRPPPPPQPPAAPKKSVYRWLVQIELPNCDCDCASCRQFNEAMVAICLNSYLQGYCDNSDPFKIFPERAKVNVTAEP